MSGKPIKIPYAEASLSALLSAPPKASALLVLAHGAGAGMAHGSMSAIAEGLAERGIATLRYQFPFMERAQRRPDPPVIAHAAVRAAIAQAQTLAPALPLFAGGRSFGGRMTSQAEAAAPSPTLKGIVFFAFPLHPAGRPSAQRADHLGGVKAPMLFLQGDRDALADLELLRPVVKGIGERATLFVAKSADHSFRAPRKSGRSQMEVMAEILDRTRDWIFARR